MGAPLGLWPGDPPRGGRSVWMGHRLKSVEPVGFGFFRVHLSFLGRGTSRVKYLRDGVEGFRNRRSPR